MQAARYQTNIVVLYGIFIPAVRFFPFDYQENILGTIKLYMNIIGLGLFVYGKPDNWFKKSSFLLCAFSLLIIKEIF